MGWKNLSYWLKGGVFGFILSFLVIVYRLYVSKICFDGVGRGECISELSIIFSSNLKDVYATYFYLIPEFVLAITAGVLIGWIYGRIKQRKR
jgi:hypothetical protein